MTKQPTIADEILSYLAAQPSAKDTFQGIAEWWILKTKIDQSIEKVGRALQHLVTEGLVISVRYQAEKETYYAVNMEKIGKIKRIVGKLEEAKGEAGD